MKDRSTNGEVLRRLIFLESQGVIRLVRDVDTVGVRIDHDLVMVFTTADGWCECRFPLGHADAVARWPGSVEQAPPMALILLNPFLPKKYHHK
jgi:hypothetical protein